jgi:hypothetical protein
MCKQNNKKKKVTCKRIEPHFFTKLCAQNKKQHPHKKQTTPTPQNRNPKNQKPLTTC